MPLDRPLAVAFVTLCACTPDPAADGDADTTGRTTTTTSSDDGGRTSDSSEASSSSNADTTGTSSESSSGSSGTDTMVTPPVTVAVAAGHTHTCALANDGRVKCWGDNTYGQLGQGNTTWIGDDETPASIDAIDLGGAAVQLSSASGYTCAVLDGGAVRCWGFGGYGNLGYGNGDTIGDDETPASAGDVDVGGAVAQIATGESHACARLDGGSVRCWGWGLGGALGYGNETAIGDDETPASAGDVPLGGTAVWIAAGRTHSCAVLDTGAVRCWGNGFAGELGYGNLDNIGDDETPADAGDVALGLTVVEVDIGYSHTCARAEAGAVRCWGDGQVGALGYGNVAVIGDDEAPQTAGNVDVGGPVAQLALGYNGYTCARLGAGALRCWGNNFFGCLGLGHTMNIGDDETPASVGDVDVGGVVVDVSAGESHTCVVLDDGAVRCWGQASNGALGYGDTVNLGDDEPAGAGGDVEVW